MKRLNRDAVIAIVLLVMCGVFLYSSRGIRTPEFEKLAPGQMDPSFWPRIILAGLVIMCGIYLVQSLLAPAGPRERRGGLAGWYRHYRNPIRCYAAFLAFLLLLPLLGMLVSGALFVFGLMTLLGKHDRTALKHHALVTLGTVGGMWFIFACGLEVQLPRGAVTGGAEEWLLVQLCDNSVLAVEAVGEFLDGALGALRFW
jgi:hypothetical protein